MQKGKLKDAEIKKPKTLAKSRTQIVRFKKADKRSTFNIHRQYNRHKTLEKTLSRL